MIFVAAAVLLSFERIAYIWISRDPDSFCAVCRRALGGMAGEPTLVLQRLFYIFKIIQLSTFALWCYYFVRGPFLSVRQSLAPVTIGAILLICGQVLNWTVFYRLGNSGVFYGNRFGYEIPWCYDFPFSVFDHPQYLGTLASIWGFFLVARFPYPDWCVLPVVETIYYSIGAWLER